MYKKHGPKYIEKSKKSRGNLPHVHVHESICACGVTVPRAMSENLPESDEQK